MCVVARQYLANDPPFSPMNLVASRNLLIYIQPVLQRKIIPSLRYALKPSDFLTFEVRRALRLSPTCSPPYTKSTRFTAKSAELRDTDVCREKPGGFGLTALVEPSPNRCIRR
jgi:two-component system, chemotaxis family, CheB/CheR fusion protein